MSLFSYTVPLSFCDVICGYPNCHPYELVTFWSVETPQTPIFYHSSLSQRLSVHFECEVHPKVSCVWTLGSQPGPLLGKSREPSGGRLPDAVQYRLDSKIRTGLCWIQAFCFAFSTGVWQVSQKRASLHQPLWLPPWRRLSPNPAVLNLPNGATL